MSASFLRPSSFVVAAATLLALCMLLPTGCSGSSDASAKPPVTCTPGNYVFCRCQNRDEGTKVCNEDGRSFGRCDPCESPTNPAIPDNPDQPPVVVDAGGDGPPSGACGDKIIDDGEECDDGNKIEDDGCNSQCRLAGADPLTSRSCPGLAVHVWSKPVEYVGSTVGSTNTGTAKPGCTSTTGGNPTSGSAASDRVFQVVAHQSGTMTVTTTNTNYDSFLYAAAAAQCVRDNVAHLACANNVNGSGGETLTFPVQSGTGYSVFVDGAGTAQGAFRVTFSIK